MKRIELQHTGFHGTVRRSVMVPSDAQSGDEVEVSARVAKRLNDAVCGMSDCTCGERIAHPGAHMHTAPISYDHWYITVP